MFRTLSDNRVAIVWRTHDKAPQPVVIPRGTGPALLGSHSIASPAWDGPQGSLQVSLGCGQRIMQLRSSGNRGGASHKHCDSHGHDQPMLAPIPDFGAWKPASKPTGASSTLFALAACCHRRRDSMVLGVNLRYSPRSELWPACYPRICRLSSHSIPLVSRLPVVLLHTFSRIRSFLANRPRSSSDSLTVSESRSITSVSHLLVPDSGRGSQGTRALVEPPRRRLSSNACLAWVWSTWPRILMIDNYTSKPSRSLTIPMSIRPRTTPRGQAPFL
jgi:hypothetical protein